MLYTLKLRNAVCQLYLETGKKLSQQLKISSLLPTPLQKQILKHQILTVLQASSSKPIKNRVKGMILSSFYETQMTLLPRLYKNSLRMTSNAFHLRAYMEILFKNVSKANKVIH